MTSAPSSWYRHPLARRLPLVVVLIAGLWVFQGRTTEREIVWRLPVDAGEVEKIEIQLHDPEGVLVQRSEFFYGAGPSPRDVSLRLKLDEARYESRVLLTPRSGSARIFRSPVDVRGDVVVVSLGGP